MNYNLEPWRAEFDAWWDVHRVGVRDIKNAGGFAAKVWKAALDGQAAELRRLHAENERLRATLAASCDDQRQEMWEAGPGGGCVRALEAERVSAELLDAMRHIKLMLTVGLPEYDYRDMVDVLEDAIKKAEGEE